MANVTSGGNRVPPPASPAKERKMRSEIAQLKVNVMRYENSIADALENNERIEKSIIDTNETIEKMQAELDEFTQGGKVNVESTGTGRV